MKTERGPSPRAQEEYKSPLFLCWTGDVPATCLCCSHPKGWIGAALPEDLLTHPHFLGMS